MLLVVAVAAPRTSRGDVEVAAGGGYADGVVGAEGAFGALVSARLTSHAHGAHAFLLADGQYLPGLRFDWGPAQDGWALQSRWLLGAGIATRPGPGPGAYLRLGIGAELLFVRVTGTGFDRTTYTDAADSTGLAGALAVGVSRLALGGQLGLELAIGGSVHGGSSDPLLDTGHEAARVDLVAIYRPWARGAHELAATSAPATLHAELGVGAGTQLNLGDLPSLGLRVGGRVVRASATGLEPYAALDVGFVPDIQYDGGDSYSQSGVALELRGLVGLGIGSRAPGPAAFVRVGAGASVLHTITEVSGDDLGESYHSTESDTSVAPALGLAIAVGRARGSGAFLGVELSASVAHHDDVTASIDLAVVARGR